MDCVVKEQQRRGHTPGGLDAGGAVLLAGDLGEVAEGVAAVARHHRRRAPSMLLGRGWGGAYHR